MRWTKRDSGKEKKYEFDVRMLKWWFGIKYSIILSNLLHLTSLDLEFEGWWWWWWLRESWIHNTQLANVHILLAVFQHGPVTDIISQRDMKAPRWDIWDMSLKHTNNFYHWFLHPFRRKIQLVKSKLGYVYV